MVIHVGTGRTPCASGITARRAGAVGAERAVELHLHHADLSCIAPVKLDCQTSEATLAMLGVSCYWTLARPASSSLPFYAIGLEFRLSGLFVFFWTPPPNRPPPRPLALTQFHGKAEQRRWGAIFG